ncbi:MAG TPA: class I SAM-dependent methyltransferase family protein, partial [bacterium]
MKNSLDAALKRFARTLLRIEQSDLPSFKKTFFDEIDRIAELIEISPEPERNREEFFRLCGVVDQSLLHGRTRQKPLGYSGDFLLLDWIYTQKTSESGIGKLYDELFHTYEASRAVRNRKEYFNRLCNTLAEEKRADIEVLNLGCGSCREVVEAVSSRANGYVYRFHCVDHESLAIEYARKILSGSEAEPYVDL